MNDSNTVAGITGDNAGIEGYRDLGGMANLCGGGNGGGAGDDGGSPPSGEVLLVTGFYGMKCDADGCGWSDMTVPRSAYPEYRNAPCPSCGANLLTDEDWQIVLTMEAATEWARDNAAALGLADASGPAVSIDYDEIKTALGVMKAALSPKAPVAP